MPKRNAHENTEIMCFCHRLLLLVTDWSRRGVYGLSFRDQLHLTAQERACRAMSLENLVQGRGLRQRHADAIQMQYKCSWYLSCCLPTRSIAS